ncbi:MAG: acetate kinase [Thermoleophilia bacterium]|nr:acetate kinase [Thermoleophilia bacterium]
MYVLVINSGSSSVKFGLYSADTQELAASGAASKIGEPGSYLSLTNRGVDSHVDIPAADHADALHGIVRALLDPEHRVLTSVDEIQAIGHRVVHGGNAIIESKRIDDETIALIERCVPLAPLHNPPNLVGIVECRRLFPHTPQVAVLDTAFHQTMPPRAYHYAIPPDYCDVHGIRRYGFHGTSFRYVSQRAAELVGGRLEDLRMVICHLGNGSSIAAVKAGKSVDTSMGMTPLEGLMMGTRSGDIDPGAVLFMMTGPPGLSPSDVDRVLNKESGFLGLSGRGNDVRDVLKYAADGDARCALALEMYAYRITKYVGAYAAAMGGIDVLVFTAGIGENSAQVREAVCTGLEFLGVELDGVLNDATHGEERDISRREARTRVLVVPTNEELMIVRDTLALTQA